MTGIAPGNPLSPFLSGSGVVILDGGLATELERRGADLNDPLWSAKLLIDQPDLIRAVHRDYYEAGADVATTAGYQATFEGLAKRGFDAGGAAALMRTAVSLATDARDAFWATARHRPGRLRPLVAASIGPYGAMLADGSEYRGNYGLTVEALIDFHRPRMRILAASGADLLACETIPCLAEAVALAHLLGEFPQVRAWISFSCRDGLHNSQGESIAACATALDGFDQVVSVGVNCTPPQYVESLCRAVAGSTGKPIAAYPNSGELYDASGKHWHGRPTTDGFAAAAQLWQQAGARLIGGCCRTTPTDIRAVRAEMLIRPAAPAASR
jgi:homocysteine S-methyltransferase